MKKLTESEKKALALFRTRSYVTTYFLVKRTKISLPKAKRLVKKYGIKTSFKFGRTPVWKPNKALIQEALGQPESPPNFEEPSKQSGVGSTHAAWSHGPWE